MDQSLSKRAARAAVRILAAVLLVRAAVFAQGYSQRRPADKRVEDTKAHYTKFDYRIPMRDGVRLFTSVYVPKDSSRPYPILLERTPYSVAPYGIDNDRAVLGPSEAYEKEGFIFAYQDVRGRCMSEGEFVDIPYHKTHFSGPADTDESTDTADTINWLVKHVANNNGAVGMWGISYPGFYAAFGLIDAPPALKAVSPQAPMADVGNGDDAYHNGALFLAANFGFYSMFRPRPDGPSVPRMSGRFSFGTPDQYDFFLGMGPLSNAKALFPGGDNPYWDELVSHTTYDEYWRRRALTNDMTNVKPAVLVVGGWFDAEDLGGTPKLFRAVSDGHPASAVILVMGPWTHGGWDGPESDRVGDVSFGSMTGDFFRERIELPFFLFYLKGQGAGPASPKDGRVPKAWVFETGTDVWRSFDAWPPKDVREKSLYLCSGGRLSFSPEPPGPGGDFDEYPSDPARPVPVIGRIGPGMPYDYMTGDQRFASERPDVLVYETDPLDRDITIAGPVTASLKVATSGTDSDFDVKLIDVYPNDYPDPEPNPAGVRMGGYQQLLRGEPFRGKFREDRAKPEPFIPGRPARIEFAMPDVCHTFRPGHRIMVQIQSSWFPLTDRNPQKFLDIPKAKAADFVKAVERIYRGGIDGSRLKVLALD
jgi:putative CocE/NonD family hydrolase